MTITYTTMKEYILKEILEKQLKYNGRYKIALFAICGFFINFLYAFYHGVLGIISHSPWFLSLCAYYIILSSMRFGIAMHNRQNISTQHFITKFCGIMLIMLAFTLSCSVYLSLITDAAVKHQEIVMITIATYTFYKNYACNSKHCESRKENVLLQNTIRNIGRADAAASILSLQRSMLVSFGDTKADEIFRMNTITGAAVFLFILYLGIDMILRGRRE